jgi:hypothetical protein
VLLVVSVNIAQKTPTPGAVKVSAQAVAAAFLHSRNAVPQEAQQAVSIVMKTDRRHPPR